MKLDRNKNNSKFFFAYFAIINFYYDIFNKLLKNLFFKISNKTRRFIILNYYE